MKKLMFLFLVTLSIHVWAAPIDFLPVTVYQPDGTELHCFASGDEFFNFLHDADGYTIIQGEDGWYYYAKEQEGLVVATQHIAGKVNPENVHLTKWAKISHEEYRKKRDAMWAEVETMKSEPVRAPHDGTMNNLAIYIRFADDSEIVTTRQVYEDRLNQPTGTSMKSYFSEVSYNMLTINTTHYPPSAMSTNFSYQDSYNRNYYQPYNATTNPNGYQNSTERRLREHTLLVNAVNWVNANYSVPAGLDIDADNDGDVDNVCFFIKGDAGGWSDLLWAHRWVLYTYNVQINGKRVYDYTFQPENQVSVRVLSHEMFHALGAPDLYHYYNDTHIAPVGPWDLMESGGGHMTAYMKWKYSNQTWISSIPEITVSGTYTLNPITSSTNNCYKIASPYTAGEYFVVEYRRNTGTFEGLLPGSGLIVYRINPAYDGNADGPPDELYIYRPNGTLTVNGTVNSAHFSSGTGRTQINDGTNPSSFLGSGAPGGLDIWGVTAAGSTISFNVGLQDIFDVTLSSNPAGAGVLTGDGTYFLNDNVVVTAVANTGFDFVNWTENSVVVSSNATYNFVVSQDRDLVANFVANGMFCDTLSNTEASNPVNYTWSTFWGFVGGHSGRNWTQFAEKFTASSPTPFHVEGMLVAVAKAHDSGLESPVVFKLYEGGTMPGNVVATKTMNINDFNAGFWNYVEFDVPVLTTGEYYLGYEISYLPPHDQDTFSVYLSNYSQATFNSAWANTATGWDSYNNLITSVTFNGHLWIRSVNCTQSYEITLESDPSGAGVLAGDGFYVYGDSVFVSALSQPGYAFDSWTENSVVVSLNPAFSFVASANRHLVAHFQVLTSCEEHNLQAITVYPNPVGNEYLVIEGVAKGTQLVVTDIHGRILYESQLNTSRELLPMEGLSKGVYMLHFTNKADKNTKKIVKY